MTIDLTRTATEISIHAPRGGSDAKLHLAQVKIHISIHAPRGGSDRPSDELLAQTGLFQSTLPVGGATLTH